MMVRLLFLSFANGHQVFQIVTDFCQQTAADVHLSFEITVQRILDVLDGSLQRSHGLKRELIADTDQPEEE